MQKVMLDIGPKRVEAEKMSFKMIEEPWSLCRLEDGTTFKIKLVISDVFKLPENDPITGLPQLIVRAANIISVDPPDASSRKDIQ
jgi:hypothetical protein